MGDFPNCTHTAQYTDTLTNIQYAETLSRLHTHHYSAHYIATLTNIQYAEALSRLHTHYTAHYTATLTFAKVSFVEISGCWVHDGAVPVCIYKHIYIHIYMYTYIHTYTHIYTHPYTYTYIHTHTCTHIHTHIHIHTHTYTHIHIHTHTSKFIPVEHLLVGGACGKATFKDAQCFDQTLALQLRLYIAPVNVYVCERKRVKERKSVCEELFIPITISHKTLT
jgi:hypothetical protein